MRYKIDGDKLKTAILLQAVHETDGVVEHYLDKIGYNTNTYYRDRRVGYIPEKRVELLREAGVETDSFIIGMME